MNVETGKKQTYKNVIVNILAFCVQFITSFYISPVVVSGVGTSAYGFIGLANDFVSYASIITSVFNSVAARFIANSFYKKDYEKANNYFNSLVLTNIALSGLFGLASILLVPNLQIFISIPTEIAVDVKITFAITFLSYIVSLVTMVFTTSTFVANRTDMQGVRNIINHIVRFGLIVILFNFVSIKLYWTAFATLFATTIVAIMNIKLTRILTPELTFDLKKAKGQYALDLAKSGCWMALTTLSTILLRGVDLTIANVMLGDYEMGILSIARTFPNNFTSVISTIAPIFTPVLIAYYAQRNTPELLERIKQSINVMALIMYVPVSGFIVYGVDFYRLWQKSLSNDEVVLVAALSSITVMQAYFNSTTSTMAQLSVVVNKLKLPVLISFGCGLLSIILDIILIKFTSLGIYAIALSPTIVMIFRYVIFNSIYGAYCLGQNKGCFFPNVIKTWISIPVLILLMNSIKHFIPVHSWRDLLINAAICAVLGYSIMYFFYGKVKIRNCSN